MYSHFLASAKRPKRPLGVRKDSSTTRKWMSAKDEGQENDMSAASETEEAEVAPKAIEKKTSAKPAKPLPTRVAKPRKSKGVAKAKLSTLRGKKKQGTNKATKDGAGKAGNEGPGPRKTFNEELGSYGAEYEAEAIVDSKLVKRKRQYLVKWVGWPESSNTWEPEENLHNAGNLVAAFDVEYPDKP